MGFAKAWIPVAFLIVTARLTGAADLGGGSSAPGSSVRDARVLAARIDSVLAARWATAKSGPPAMADDAEFLRRVCLDLIGKIPTAAEAGDFLDDPSPDKRFTLVERLLDSPAYTTRATEIWRQLLLPEADTEDQARAVASNFEAWLRRKVVEEAGYDQMVREILTAKLDNQINNNGLAVRGDPSPAAYFVAKENKPENLASGVSRVFLGVRLECAQCHDHPFARWKREQFWGFAAFFAEVPNGQDGLATRPASKSPVRELAIPGTKQVIKAGHLDGSNPIWRARANSREVLADWMTAPENPYFARAIVNRVWARFFGIGLVEPVDDLGVESSPEFGGLLAEVAAQFRSHRYNLKFLIRVVTATRAYNLSSVTPAGESTLPPFSSMPVRGLSAGQLFDSLIRATGAEETTSRARFLELFGNRDEKATEAQTSILQALTMMNGSFIADATNPESGGVLGAIAKAPYLDTSGQIETLYLAALARRPKPEELVMLVAHVDRRKTAEDRAKALSDVFWALLNGSEFYLNH